MALAKGMPVVAGAQVTSAWDAPKAGVITPPATNNGAVRTAVTIVAYDPQTQRFKFANSWGTSWGDKGFAYFTRDDAGRVLDDQLGLWAVEMIDTSR
jgi:C1A family cysteine protease